MMMVQAFGSRKPARSLGRGLGLRLHLGYCRLSRHKDRTNIWQDTIGVLGNPRVTIERADHVPMLSRSRRMPRLMRCPYDGSQKENVKSSRPREAYRPILAAMAAETMALGTSARSTIVDVLGEHVTRDQNAVAIVWSQTGALSFGDLARNIRQVGLQFRAAGIGSTSRVGIALPRGLEAAILSIAVCCSAILVPLNPNLAVDELQEELKSLRLDALIVAQGEHPTWLSAAGDTCGLFAIASFDEGPVDIVLRQERGVGRPRGASVLSAHSWAAIFKTSGTTGTSKRVPVTHGNLLAMSAKMQRWLELTSADRSACIMPIYYNAGFKATLLVPLLIGCSVALPASTASRDFEQWLGELRPTWLTASPAFLQSLVEKLRDRPVGEARSSGETSLRFVLSTSSYLPPATAAELQTLLRRPVVEFYGLCEAGMITGPVLPPAKPRLGTVGRIPYGELAIQDGAGLFLSTGQTGNVVVRGPSVTPGYIVDDIDNAPSGLQDGWLTTGDIGAVGADGLLTIIGRHKEIINRGGEKVSPYQVERALLANPAVREAAVFSVPHPRLGENVGAAVVLHASASATSRELLEFIYSRVAHYEMPRRIHIVESLPVGATGKIQRSQLSKMFDNRERHGEAPVAPLEVLIAEIWQRLLKLADIGMDEDFFELGGDSLQATEMLLELEQATHHRIEPSDVRVLLTIRHLAEVLAGAAAVEARKEVITQARSGTGTPLFLWHGDCLGWGLYAFRLATMLDGDGPVYLLHSILDGDDRIETIEGMVQCQLPHIAAVAPDGPIRLAGYCHGGLAALEVAARLEKAGRTVETVILIDSYSINARPIARLIAPLITFAGYVVPGRIGFRLRRDGMLALWGLIRLLQGDTTLLDRLTHKVQAGTLQTWHQSPRALYLRAMARYVPRRIRAEMVCLLSEERAAERACATDPWKRLATSVRTALVQGEHHTCVSRHVGELAACLNRMSFHKGNEASSAHSPHASTRAPGK